MNISRYSTISLSLIALALSFSTLLMPSGSMAQALEEVLVTAQKREENLQDVPISISAFTEEALETLRINDISDIGQFTPGLFSVPAPTDPSGSRLTLRGLVVNNTDIGVDNKVAIYQDGIYVGKSVGTSFDLADLERVEILKGPQGTLYGRNASAGAINLISKRASTDESGGHLDFTIGTFNEFSYKGSVNVAVSDRMAFKVSAVGNQRAGWVENNGLGNDFYGYDKQALRFDATILPMDNVSVHYSYEKSDNEFEPAYFQSLPLATALTANFVNGIPTSISRKDDIVATAPTETGNLDTENHALTLQWDWSDSHSLKALLGYRYTNNSRTIYFFPELNVNDFAFGLTWGGSVFLIDQQFSAYAGLANVNLRPGITELLPQTTIIDLGGSTFRPTLVTGQVTSAFSSDDTRDDLHDNRQYTIELTQSGVLDDLFGYGSVDYTAGIFYLNENTANANQDYSQSAGNVGFEYLALAGLVAALPKALAAQTNVLNAMGMPCATAGGTGACLTSLTAEQIAGLTNINDAVFTTGNPATQPIVDGVRAAVVNGALAGFNATGATGGLFSGDTDAFAIFGQATWTPIIPGMEVLEDRLHLTLGLRYSYEEKSGRLQKLSPLFADQTNLQGNAIALISSDDDYDSFDPSFNVRYDINDDMMAYFSVGTSFLSGGYGAAAGTLDQFRFDQEKILAYEIGFKGDLFDIARLNAAVFFYDVSDQQQTVSHPVNASVNGVGNTDAETKGFEVDLRVDVPYVEGLSAGIQYAYLNSKQENLTNPFVDPGTATAANCPDGGGQRMVSADGNCIELRQSFADPENTLSASVDYRTDLDMLGVPGTLVVHVGYNFIDETNVTTNVSKDAVNLVDARVALSDVAIGDGMMNVALWAQNLLDDSYIVNRINFSTSAGGFAHDIVNFGPPLTVGLDLKYSF